MPQRLLSRSSLVLLLLCAVVFAQKPVRLLVQGFVAVVVDSVEKADEATSSSIVVAMPPVPAAPPVLRAPTAHAGAVATVHIQPLSVLRI